MATFDEKSKQFYDLDKAIAALKGVINVETGDAVAVKRRELEVLQDAVEKARQKVEAKKAEMAAIVAAHPMSAKHAELLAKRREVERELVGMKGKEDWWMP